MTFQDFADANDLTFVSTMNLEGDDFLNTFNNVFAVSDNFDYNNCASQLGLSLDKDLRNDVKKYNGVGFVTFHNNKSFPHNESLEVIFYNDKPIAIKFYN